MSKEIKFGLEALAEVKKGVDLLAEAVKVTFGPKGNTVIIYEDNFPKVTKDGVTVARSISSSNPLYDVGIQLVKEAASKTADSAGDGTTTSTILAQSLINDIFNRLSNNESPLKIKQELEIALAESREYLKETSTKVGDNPESIRYIATISANGDKEVGEIISDTISKIGYDGVISLNESNTGNTYVDVVRGMKVPRGYISPYFITNQSNRTAILTLPLIFIYNGVLNDTQRLFGLLEKVVKDDKSILLIANDYSPEVINALLRNVNRGILKVVAIKTPGVGEYKKDLLEDISAVTGAKVFTTIPDSIEYLGTADTIISSSDNTSIVGGGGKKEDISIRVNQLKESLNNDIPDFLREDIKSRIAKLSGGVAAIHVGATTEVELSEKRDRIEDAVCATRAAIEEGVVTGAGYIQANLAGVLSKKGLNILSNALLTCRELIAESTDISYEDAIKNNIIDPAKVTRVSIENAVSVALMYLSTKCIIIDGNG